MNRKIISAIACVILCFGLVTCVSAAPNDYVIDELDFLYNDELEALNELGAEVYEECGVGVFYVFTETAPLSNYNVDSLVDGITDYVVVLENEDKWLTVTGGKGDRVDEDTLWELYEAAESYAKAVEDIFTYVKTYFGGEEASAAEENEYLVFDEADLLSDSEENALNKKLQKISNKYEAQIVVCTLESMDGGDIDEFVEFFYDEMELGYGKNHDGVLLMVSMDPREFRILSNGMAADAIDTDAIENITDTITSNLSDGEYADAFDAFADKCQYYLDGHINGFPFKFGRNLVICLIIGAVAGLIVAFVLKGQLKSVRKQDQANVYVKPGSMQITVHSDYFLYRDVTKTKKESSSSSSSGSSRNVGGGSF